MVNGPAVLQPTGPRLFWRIKKTVNRNINERKALLLRGPEVAEALGISRALAYRWMQNGVLPTVRVSRSVRVPHEGLLRWIEHNTNQAA
jgi:excisionase family DNA binding protein